MDDFVPINLPSKCFTYTNQDGSKIDPSSVLARSYQGRDELYLSQINPSNLERNYLEVLKSILQGIDPLQLTLGDRLYLIIWEYVNSYDCMMRVKTICPYCLSEIEVEVDLRNLETVDLPDNYEQPYEITLPISKEKIQLRLLTVEDEIEVERFSKKNKKEANLYRYARTIVSSPDVMSRMKRLSSMKAKDYLTVVSFQDKFFHGPEMKTKFTCTNDACGEEDVLDIPFRSSFFVPEISQFSNFDGEGV